MRLIGKCPPEIDSLSAANERGFDAVEIYLTKDHIDEFDETLTNIQETSIEVASIHTPHVTTQDLSYFEKADDLAKSVGGTLVVHSQYLHHTHIDELEAIDFDADYGYENNPGASKYYIENSILGEGFDLILDTAHLFMAEQEYLGAIEDLLQRYESQIPVIHLNDATTLEDGLPFGDGEIDLKNTVDLLGNYYTGDVILEVMPEYQSNALSKTRSWLEIGES